MKEQLRLKLQLIKADTDVFVIDRVEQTSKNQVGATQFGSKLCKLVLNQFRRRNQLSR
jgi:hypothetical protein